MRALLQPSRGGALPGLPRAVRLAGLAPRRLLSQDQSFSGDRANAYAKVFEQHFHPKGPFLAISKALKGGLHTAGAHRFLDLASGPGEPGLHIAAEFPSARVLLTDLSPDQVAKAAERARGNPRVECAAMDAQDMRAHADGSFDAVTCCFGVMFFPRPLEVFKEVARVLKPGGLFIATYWIEMPIAEVGRLAAVEATGDGSVAPAFDPLNFKEAGRFARLAGEAGFSVEPPTQSSYPIGMPGHTDPDVTTQLLTMPVSQALAPHLEAGGEGFRERLREAVFRQCEAHGALGADGEVSFDCTFEMAVARKAG